MDRPQHSDLVTALTELSWSDVKRMAIHLDESVDLALLEDIEREYPIKERLLYTMKAWLERDCDASWAKVVSALQRIGQNVLAKKIKSTAADPIIAQLPMNSPDHRPEGDLPVISPPIKVQPNPGLAFLHQENEACASLVPVLDHSCTDSHDVSGSDRTKTQARKEHQIQSITVPSPVTLHGQTESGPPVVSPIELQPSPGPDSLHQLQPENEATVIRTRREPAFDHSASLSQDSYSDWTRAQETTEQETSVYPTVPQQDSEISGWRRERRQYVAIMAAVVGAALAAAESGDYGILLALVLTGFTAALVAFGVKLCIVNGVPTELSKLAVFVAGAAVVVAVLVGAGTARTAATASRATVAVATASDSVMAVGSAILLPAVGISVALGAAAIAVCTAEEVLPVAVAAVGAVTVGVGAGVMVAAAVASATAGVIAVAGAGEVAAEEVSQVAAAAAQAAAAAVAAMAITVVTAAVGAPVLKTTAVGLAAVVAVAAVAVGLPPAGRLAAAVTVGTVIVAETAAVVGLGIAVAVGPPSAAAIAAVIALAAGVLKVASW